MSPAPPGGPEASALPHMDHEGHYNVDPLGVYPNITIYQLKSKPASAFIA